MTKIAETKQPHTPEQKAKYRRIQEIKNKLLNGSTKLTFQERNVLTIYEKKQAKLKKANVSIQTVAKSQTNRKG